jgi:transcriptional regulator with XRE-family HTH domain
MSLAANIKRLRLQKQLSLPDLATITDLSKGYVYQLEAGEMVNPSLDKLLKISRALDCTIADLVGEPRAVARADLDLEMPQGLLEFAKRKKREGVPLEDAELRTLARLEYRGKRPETESDWSYVYEFLKRTLGDNK